MARALVSTHAARDTRRMHASILIDLVVCVATIPVYVFCLVQMNAILGHIFGSMLPLREHRVPWETILLQMSAGIGLSLVPVVVVAYLGARGQTPGLAAVRLVWRDGMHRVARRRLLGEPQFWCAALPSLYVFLAMLSSIPWYLAAMNIIDPAIPDAIDAITLPTLVAGALAIIVLMVFSRKHPGRLVSRVCGYGS